MSERAFILASGGTNATKADGGKSKGKGKGKAYEMHLQKSPDLTEAEKELKAKRTALLRNASRKDPIGGGGTQTPEATEEDAEMGDQENAEAAMTKHLLTMGLHPAPLLSELKKYPRPVLKNDTPAEDQAAATAISKMEEALQHAKESMMAPSIIAVFNKELATAKAAQAKAAKGAPKATLDQLQERLKHSDTASANAQERHQAHLNAVDEQITQLKAIREFKAKDFAEAQTAFAARLVEDRKAIADLRAELGSLVGAEPAQPDQKAQEINEGVKTAMEDLARHCDVPSAELPVCPDAEEESEKTALVSLWQFYAQVAFGEVPAINFDALQLSPSYAHTLVGDSVWNGFWTTKAATVTGGQYIPTSLHNYLRFVVQAKNQEMANNAAAKELAQHRLNAARSLAAQRKSAGDPF